MWLYCFFVVYSRSAVGALYEGAGEKREPNEMVINMYEANSLTRRESQTHTGRILYVDILFAETSKLLNEWMRLYG